MNKINMTLTVVSFLREDEPQEPYGTSCLIDAFKSGNTEDDSITPFVIDANMFWNHLKEDFCIDWEKLADYAACRIIYSGCNVAAFSCFSWCEDFCKLVTQKIKGHKNIEKIILGGPSITGDIDSLQKEYPNVDLFIESYGEKIFANLRHYLNSGQKLVKDLPDFCKLQSPYLSGRVAVKQGMTVRMELRRGCCFQCTYCRYKDSERHIYNVGNSERWKRELDLFHRKKVHKINVLDAYFNEQGINKQMGLDFLRYCKQIGLKCEISLQIRPEYLDDEYLEIISTMPNVIVEIGIQSLDKKVMNAIKRGHRDKVLDTLKKVTMLGMRTEITMIYGLPYQNAESFKKDLLYLNNMGFETIHAFRLSIYNGTELYDTYQNYGLKVHPDNLGQLIVYDNPTHDVEKMAQIYQDYVAARKLKAA